ncbi:MAG: hypothetical protein WC655_27080 [Candidatus Hydrogenedentales bacterium]
MSFTDILIVGALVALLVALLRANGVLGRNPYQQLTAHEDLVGRLPQNMSFAERLRLVGLFGLSPNNPGRTWLLAVAVMAIFLVVLWLP